MNMKNNILEQISSRHCKRAFLKTPVSDEVVREVLETAAHAPSAKNTQPWEVCVLRGKTLESLKKKMCSKFDQGIPGKPDYAYYPEPLPESFRKRSRECGISMLELKGIRREDREAQRAHARENFKIFNAPLAMIFHITRNAAHGTFMDTGFFIQNVMLGFQSLGVGTCPQYSITIYSDTIREILSLQDDRLVVCGLAVGIPDPGATVNTFVPARIPVNEFTRWYD